MIDYKQPRLPRDWQFTPCTILSTICWVVLLGVAGYCAFDPHPIPPLYLEHSKEVKEMIIRQAPAAMAEEAHRVNEDMKRRTQR